MTQVVNDIGLFLVKLISQNGFGDRVHVSIGPSEVILSFCHGQNRANVHFLGKGHYDYAYIKDGVFVAGEQEGDLTQNINPDLLNYLNTIIFPKEKNDDGK